MSLDFEPKKYETKSFRKLDIILKRAFTSYQRFEIGLTKLPCLTNLIVFKNITKRELGCRTFSGQQGFISKLRLHNRSVSSSFSTFAHRKQSKKSRISCILESTINQNLFLSKLKRRCWRIWISHHCRLSTNTNMRSNIS